MSAFMVSDNTMNRAVQAFDSMGDRNLRSYGYSTCEALDQLGRELFAMNSRALRDRYGDKEQKPEDFTFRYTVKNCSKVMVFKALSCLIYQCSEGKVFEEVLYKMLTDRQSELAREIVSNLPEYDEAPWD